MDRGSKGSISIRPAATSSAMDRSDRIIGGQGYYRAGWGPDAGRPLGRIGPSSGCGSMVERKLPKLETGVRFPSSALLDLAPGVAGDCALPEGPNGPGEGSRPVD